jgi:hypothetical protein
MLNKWIRKGKRKLWVNIPEGLYDQLQLQAKRRNLLFSKYINRALMRYMIEENRYEIDENDIDGKNT